MSESVLPDDLSLWPKNPYELLGVRPGTSERDIRRAYTQLIRTWKPEQFPDQFRRIRDAYEAALRCNSYFRENAEEQPPSAGPLEEAPPQPAPAPVDELDALWELALDGQEETAYRRFVELDERRPGRADVALRLYWLLTVNRHLDPQRVPCDWLVQGLVSNGATGPLRALYLRELANDPAEAATPRCDRLLALPMAAGRLADLAEARWSALVRLGAWDRLTIDLETLRDLIGREDEQAWLRLVCSLVDRIAWVDVADADLLLGRCHEEIKRLEHLAIHLSSEFDRFDGLQQAAKGWRALTYRAAVPYALQRLIPLAWTQP